LDKIGPSRLIVRDCHPTADTVKMWKNLDTELLYTEYKSENGINRITSAANPRFIERVAKDSEFEFEMIYTAYDLKNGNKTADDASEDLSNLRMAIHMLEHNFLGKSGSRGYGRVEFRFEDPVWVKVDDYIGGKTEEEKAKAKANLAKASASLRKYEDLKPTANIPWEIKEL
jgi:CRISPR-associated protein Csm3